MQSNCPNTAPIVGCCAHKALDVVTLQDSSLQFHASWIHIAKFSRQSGDNAAFFATLTVEKNSHWFTSAVEIPFLGDQLMWERLAYQFTNLQFQIWRGWKCHWVGAVPISARYVGNPKNCKTIKLALDELGGHLICLKKSIFYWDPSTRRNDPCTI